MAHEAHCLHVRGARQLVPTTGKSGMFNSQALGVPQASAEADQ